MEVAHSKMGLGVSQHKYVSELLKEIRMFGCNPANTPIDSTRKFGRRTRNLVS